MHSVRSQVSISLLLAAGLCGCSGGSSSISGKVTAGGKEVTAGTIVFSPIAAEGDATPGKPGLADIRSDGSYSLTLELTTRGQAQKYTVRFTPPPLVVTSKSKDVVVPYLNMIPKQAEIEVKPGNSVIDVELISKWKK